MMLEAVTNKNYKKQHYKHIVIKQQINPKNLTF